MIIESNIERRIPRHWNSEKIEDFTVSKSFIENLGFATNSLMSVFPVPEHQHEYEQSKQLWECECMGLFFF